MPYLDPAPTPADLETVRAGLIAASEAQGGPQHPWRLELVLRDDSGAVAGGVVGNGFWGWLFVDQLWVREDLRGQGHGRRLLEAAEKRARNVGAVGVWLDTFSFQARDFYEKLGYRVCGEIPDHPPGHSRFFLQKRL